MSQFAGNVDFTEQPAERAWRAGEGFSIVRSWVGAPQNLDAFLASGLPSGFINYRTESSTPVQVKVVAEYALLTSQGGSGQADPISLIWTMPNIEAQLPIIESNVVQNAFAEIEASTSAATLLGIEEALTDGLQANTKFDDLDIQDTFLLSDDVMTFLRNLYVRMKKNAVVFASQFVLQKTQTVIQASQIRAAFTNVDRWHSTARLELDEPTLPTAPLIDWTNLSNPNESSVVAWLKKTPTIGEADRGRFQIVQQYWGSAAVDEFKDGAILT